jgi:tetratricopeptide (TPR) repeat protein
MLDKHLAHIAGLEARFGVVSEEVAVALDTLARLICQHEEPAEAVPYFSRCIAIREELRGPASVIADLDTWIDQDNPVGFQIREPFIRKRLDIKTSLFGEFDPWVAEECDGLASTYIHLKRYSDARPLLERSLAAKKRIDGAHTAEVAATLEKLVDVCLRIGDRDRADRYFERCVKATEAVFGPHRRELGERLVGLAVMYAGSCKWQRRPVKARMMHKAMPMFERGLAGIERNCGPDSFKVQKALAAMSLACLESDEFWRAEPLLKRLLSTTERSYGNDAAALLWILVELALGYAREKSDRAEPMLERSFDVLKAFIDAERSSYQGRTVSHSGQLDALYGSGQSGLLEKLLRAAEIVRGNVRRERGASCR